MELFTAVKDALITHLGRLPWMDEETQKKAQDKVRPGETDRWGRTGVELRFGSRDPSGRRREQKAHGHRASIITNMWHIHPGDNIKGGDKGSEQEKFLLIDSG